MKNNIPKKKEFSSISLSCSHIHCVMYCLSFFVHPNCKMEKDLHVGPFFNEHSLIINSLNSKW